MSDKVKQDFDKMMTGIAIHVVRECVKFKEKYNDELVLNSLIAVASNLSGIAIGAAVEIVKITPLAALAKFTKEVEASYEMNKNLYSQLQTMENL